MTDTTKFYAVVEFENGLQIVPYNWLSTDLKRAAWPNFTNNKKYDKVVKLMETSESTWMEYNIKKIYGTYVNYSVAKKKLKEAEDLSDLNSNTENEEHLKKSRKDRAAVIFNTPMTSTSSNDEMSDENFNFELLKVPKRSFQSNSNIITYNKRPKLTKVAQKDQQCSLSNTKLRFTMYYLFIQRR
ncbi:uncharacterized protein [Anoplolepis gracilipes]|uniref:uncharacterized protein n=1 Tax=Anoplolepis gracilipes TaxID=354296 RepID=UPI003BA1FF24